MSETEPLNDSLADAARQCREYAKDGAPTAETLAEWADLFDRARCTCATRDGRYWCPLHDPDWPGDAE